MTCAFRSTRPAASFSRPFVARTISTGSPETCALSAPLQEREGIERPLVSLWLTGLKETIRELPAFVRIAADLGVREVYLQRLVFFDQAAIGIARPDQALFENRTRDEAVYLEEAADLARSLGITFNASGAASEPGLSLKKMDGGSPWSLCRRPWSLMYFTANGRALPCCIAPFADSSVARALKTQNQNVRDRNPIVYFQDSERTILGRPECSSQSVSH